MGGERGIWEVFWGDLRKILEFFCDFFPNFYGIFKGIFTGFF